MKVKQLMDMLKNCDPDARVLIGPKLKECEDVVHGVFEEEVIYVDAYSSYFDATEIDDFKLEGLKFIEGPMKAIRID
jgi:hypothetical protein